MAEEFHPNVLSGKVRGAVAIEYVGTDVLRDNDTPSTACVPLDCAHTKCLPVCPPFPSEQRVISR